MNLSRTVSNNIIGIYVILRELINVRKNLTFHLQTEKDVQFVSEMVCGRNA